MSVGSFLKHEGKALLGVTLFFFAGFLVILLVFELMLARHDIRFNAAAKALFGALVLSKVVVVLRKRKFMQFAGSRGAVRAFFRSAIAMVGVWLVLLIENVIHAWGDTGGFFAAVAHVAKTGSGNRMLAIPLLVGLLLMAYNCWAEFVQSVGREKRGSFRLRGHANFAPTCRASWAGWGMKKGYALCGLPWLKGG